MLSFFAYRSWMDATSSGNAVPPRIPDDDGFKEIWRLVPLGRDTWNRIDVRNGNDSVAASGHL
jgi:hypothetical protein